VATFADLNPTYAVDVARNPAINLDFAGLDLGLYGRMLSDDENVGCGDGPANIPIEVQRTRKMEVTVQRGPFGEESIELFIVNGLSTKHSVYLRSF